MSAKPNSEFYQSGGMGKPSLGTIAMLKVSVLMPWLTRRTLPSPIPTCNTPVWLLEGQIKAQLRELLMLNCGMMWGETLSGA